MVGWFLVESALDDDPNHTGGIDQALRRLADSDHGPALLRLVAVGLILFGVYRLVDARLRKRSRRHATPDATCRWRCRRRPG